MGEKAADPAKLPNFDFMDDTRWTYVKGHIHGSGYYELFTDNILDLGHAAFLHTGISAPAFTIGKRNVFQDGDTVWSNVSHTDRKSVVSGQRVSVRVDIGGSGIIKKKNTN